MKHFFLSFLIIFFTATISVSAQPWDKIEQNFKTTPISTRPNPLWFWNNTEVKPAELRQQMDSLKKAGYGGVSILPFGRNFKPEYLSEAYFETYRVCVEEAKKLGLTLWIYDEYGFPSGTAGDINGDGIGRFKQKHPEHTNKRLDKTEYIVSSQSIFETTLPDEPIMAVVAMDTITFQRMDLINSVTNGQLKWKVPAGAWKVLVFTCVNAGNTIIDYLSPEAADLYIEMTHEKYYQHFSEYFGSTIVGTFFDEPTLYYAEGRTWTPDFNKKFEAVYGFSPVLYYPALWYDIGEATAEARNYLFGFRSDLYAEGYIKQVNDWSEKHNVLATGHQDNEEIINCVGTSGDLMKCFKYLSIPGIDKIGGDRPAENFYKIISSAAYNWDNSLVMSETYGDMGNIDWDQIFGIAMDQYAKGINILIPHAAWYNVEDVVFRPELSLRNPIYADSLQVFTEYLSRLNAVMQNDARWIGDIAVLYPIHTMQSGHYMDGPLGHYKGGVEIPDLDYIDLGISLFDKLGYDYQFLHPEVLDLQCSIEKDKLKLQNKVQYNSFSTLIVPGCKTISLSNLQKIKKFASAGGKVIFTTQLPSKATILSEDKKIVNTMKDLMKSKNVSFVADPSTDNLRIALEKHSDRFSLNFTGTPIRNIHKKLHDKNIWFFANPEKEDKVTEFELAGKYDLEIWDPHTGSTTNAPLLVKHNNGKTLVRMKIDGCRSLFLIESALPLDSISNKK